MFQTRFKDTGMVQQMGNLPKPHVNPSFPFSRVGIDYTGPIRIRSLSGRGHASVRGYIVVFVCFSTKAVDLDVVSSYDTKHFINAFKRFISRWDLCSHVYSDCGTNFVGADAELKAMFSKYSISKG